jgi:hypothetical protein
LEAELTQACADPAVPTVVARLDGVMSQAEDLPVSQPVADAARGTAGQTLADPHPGRPTDELSVLVGQDDLGQTVFAEIGGDKPFLVSATQSAVLGPTMMGIAMNMAVEEWGAPLELHIVTSGHLFDTFDGLQVHQDRTDGLEGVRSITAERRMYLGDDTWRRLRVDPNCGEAWRPVVYCFVDPLSETELSELAQCLAGPEIGVAVAASMVLSDSHQTRQASALVSARLEVESHERATLHPSRLSLRPVALPASQPLADLLTTSASVSTTPAWWSPPPPTGPAPLVGPADAGGTGPVTVMSTPERGAVMADIQPQASQPAPIAFHHPTLRLLGPITLEGARGTPPARAERACLEYCGWLLEHPGATATAMAQGLLVAEGTRRSNMSRLRAWLGHDQAGSPYLPEAYTGRIWLDSGVTSDWQRLCLLIAGGVDLVPTERLDQALRLVRGLPLADAAPGQWHWAEELRTDIISVVRDIAVVLTRRYLADGLIDQARWAASHALTAVPEDEVLLCARVLTEQAAGNRMEVERLVSWIARNARNLGVDLLPETVTTLQAVIAGRPAPVHRPMRPR